VPGLLLTATVCIKGDWELLLHTAAQGILGRWHSVAVNWTRMNTSQL